MKMSKKLEAKLALVTAIDKLQIAAKKLENEHLSDDEKFCIVWTLGYADFYNLEDFRLLD